MASLTAELHRPPSLTELAAQVGIRRQNIREHVYKLRAAGYLNFKAQHRQAISPVLTASSRALLGAPGFPVLGHIAAGQPIYAREQLESYTDRLSDLLPVQEGDFLLRVEGDSMTGAGYQPEDYVVVRPSRSAQEGDIVVAFLPNEETATLKRWQRDHDHVLLVAENPAYAPIRLALTEVEVQGVVVGHVGQRRKRRTNRPA